MKGRAMRRRPPFPADLVGELARGNSIFVEIMDKKFYLATNLVSYGLHGSTFDPVAQGALANQFADVVTELIDDRAIVAYAEFARAHDASTFDRFVEAFRDALLRSKIAAGQEQEFRLLSQIESMFLRALAERRRDVVSFVAPADETQGRRPLAMLPHTSALTGLVGRMNKWAAAFNGIHIVHDEQPQFSFALQRVLERLEALSENVVQLTSGTTSAAHEDWAVAGRVTLEFAASKHSRAIQAADALARFCMQRMTTLLSDQPTEPLHDEAAALLRELAKPSGVNIVAATKDARRFWPPTRHASARL
jgi:hypothetical protein